MMKLKEVKRCPWCTGDPLYLAYHDQEWGVPVFEDKKQFEFLILEAAQAGLSWLTVLRKRDNYRLVYADFNPEIVASFDQQKIESLMEDKGIIRNKLKIDASVNNARRFLEVQEKFGSFCNYIWEFIDFKPIVNHWTDLEDIPTKTKLSEIISKDLKKRGFRFLGPTIIYSHLQATGLINDHLILCFRYEEIQKIPLPKEFSK